MFSKIAESFSPYPEIFFEVDKNYSIFLKPVYLSTWKNILGNLSLFSIICVQIYFKPNQLMWKFSTNLCRHKNILYIFQNIMHLLSDFRKYHTNKKYVKCKCTIERNNKL